MEVFSGTARRVQLRQQTNRFGAVLPDFLEVEVEPADSYLKSTEVRIQPLPEIKIGDKLALGCERRPPTGSLCAIAYVNRSNGTQGRERLRLEGLVVFGVVAALITIGLVVLFGWMGTLTIPVVGLIYYFLWREELNSRHALELVLAHAKELEANERIEEQKKQDEIARQQVEAERLKAEADRLASEGPCEKATRLIDTMAASPENKELARRILRELPALKVNEPWVVRAVLSRLNDSDHSVRAEAISTLGSLATTPPVDSRILPALLNALSGEPDGEARSCAAVAVGVVARTPPLDPRIIPALVKKLGDASGYWAGEDYWIPDAVKNAAIAALVDCGEAAVPALKKAVLDRSFTGESVARGAEEALRRLEERLPQLVLTQPAESGPKVERLELDLTRVETWDDLRVELYVTLKLSTVYMDWDLFRRWLNDPKENILPAMLEVCGWDGLAVRLPEHARRLREELEEAAASFPGRQVKWVDPNAGLKC